MDEGLKIKITANAEGVAETFAKVSKSAKQSADAIGQASQKTIQAGAIAQATANSYNNLASASNKVNAPLKANKENFTGLSRVLQDLPFGIQGIGNNLTELIPAASGAGLALSVLVTAATFATTGFGAWTRGLGQNKDSLKDQIKAVNDAQDALSDYVVTLGDVQRSQLVGEQDAQKELVTLQTLYRASQDQVLSLNERKKAVDALQEQYPKYFKNISDETILAGGAQKAYEKLSTAIIAAARARAAQDAIVENQKEVLTLESQYVKAIQEEYTAQQNLNKVRESISKQSAVQLSKEGQAFTNQNALNKAQDAYNAKLAETSRLSKRIFDLQDDSKDLATSITANIRENGTGILLDPTGGVPKIKVPKAILDVERIDVNFDKARIETVGEAKNFQDIISDMVLRRQPLKLPKMDNAVLDEYRDASKLMTSFRKQFNELGLDLPNIRVGDVGGVDGLNKQFEKLLENAQTIDSLIGSSLTPAFEDMFSTIFAGGDGLQSFFQTLGQSVQQLIAKLIAAQIQALLLSVLTGLALPKTGGGIPMRGRITGIGGAAGFGGMSSLGALGGVAGLSAQGGGRMGSTPGGISVNVGVTGSLRGNGRDLVAVISNTTQRQGRNF